MPITRNMPQPGPQTEFLASPADLVIYGGAAGAGKSYALGLEGLRFVRNLPGFVGVVLRREQAQIVKAGGLRDALRVLWTPTGAKFNGFRNAFRWEGGGEIQLSHVSRDDTVSKFDGTEIAWLAFDELQHFTEYQFFYLTSRLRSTCGIRPYIRATCNPDADSWLARFLGWWIDDEGNPIPERSGKIRWYLRDNDLIKWADSAEEILAAHPAASPQSATFIPAKLADNAILMREDPAYLGRLEALPRVERLRLLGGNWKVRPTRGDYFRASDFPRVDVVNIGEIVATVRHWDLAASVVSDSNPDPDYTCGVQMGRYRNGRWIVLDVICGRWRAHDRDELIVRVAQADGKACLVSLPQDPGQAGKAQVEQLTRMLQGHKVTAARETGDKATRAAPVSSQVGAKNVDLLTGHWNAEFLHMLEAFPSNSVHDDPVDALAGAFTQLSKYNKFAAKWGG